MNYAEMTVEALEALLEEKRKEALELVDPKTLDGLDATKRAENIAAARALQEERVTIGEARDTKVAAAEKDEADLADIRDSLVDAEDETPAAAPAPEVEDETPAAAEVVAEAEAVVAEVAPEVVAEVVAVEPVPIAASSRARRVASRSGRPPAPVVETSSPRLTIVAGANVPDVSAGTRLEGIPGINEALLSRTTAFTPPHGDGKGTNLQRYNVAQIRIAQDDDGLKVDQANPHQSMRALERAQDVRRLSESGDDYEAGMEALVAAGGWCAPSENLYDLCEGESLDGIVSLPEIQVSRGGINYTSGPQFADFYGVGGPGFVQTEAEAIAGDVKTCVEVECPAFDEVRLDAIGLCIKVPILTETGYPELTERFTRGTLVAWAHQVNANVIARVEALSNANRAIANTGSSVSDALEGLELFANQKRQKYRLPIADSVEVMIPFWVRDVYKSDLRRRTGQFAPVTDAQMDSYFAASKISVQWAYDWQPLDETAEIYPDTYRVVLYRAGTFVKGATEVIKLDAVYDAASLEVNTYTGLFVESGLLVARMCWDADRITLPVCNMGRTGAADLTCEVAP